MKHSSKSPKGRIYDVADKKSARIFLEEECGVSKYEAKLVAIHAVVVLGWGNKTKNLV